MDPQLSRMSPEIARLIMGLIRKFTMSRQAPVFQRYGSFCCPERNYFIIGEEA
ncbi:MAG: hypothetical protein GX364_07670 [Firmicutes bacterium]|nr:hypothetical protein [Bacillota bacterium]